MKKLIALALVLVCALGMVSCSSGMNFNIATASKIELRYGGDGTTIEITDEEDIKYITDNINALKFSKGESSKNSSGWNYSLKWYDSGNNLIEEIVVMSKNQIAYKNYFYTTMDADSEIDIFFLGAFFGMDD